MIRHDTTHDMYRPDRPAPKKRQRVMPPRNTRREEKEAWMREKQAAKAHFNTGRKMPKREKKRHPNSAINQLIRIERERAELNAPDESGIWAI